jgi:hypothetical protein
MNTLDFVKVFDIVPHSACDLILNYLDNNDLEWEKHSWYDYGDDLRMSYEDNELDIRYDPLISDFLLTYNSNACGMYQQYLQEFEDGYDSEITKITPTRVNKYSTNTMMRVHSDLIKVIFDGNEKGIPTLSILTEISGHQNYEGGMFVICGKEIKLEKGQCIIFPSTFMYPHGVNLVTKGTRYSCITWAY